VHACVVCCSFSTQITRTEEWKKKNKKKLRMLSFTGTTVISAGGSEGVCHMDEKGSGVYVSFARTGTIRGRGRQMGQLAEERSRVGWESFG